ncbi:malonate decarboxylase holo-ACP synthase [Metapseudomonas resinovorans]|uniref:Phosphoribosyl-dephospho-CoA transferase n=1 Tax=Metapseudomonas resinovorans NBRC 106553 TaxID=1245471 RepID=S6AL15_METRE|nr:malonate decarboxylase holo-ACP synthase [Pseudomonas resinovorans]BAN45918.1 phosphoribosyl-dephospho-CoA transferase [Pseudomonas resinovorans NBRC 106553]
MNKTPRPHDLLWGMTPDQLPGEAPDWARQALAAGQPVVVRRAMCAPGLVPVGVRGAAREQRLAALMPSASIQRLLGPEQLIQHVPGDLPALRALALIKPLLDATGLPWGPTGGVGFQLATGIPVLHPASDLDLLLRTPDPVERHQARALLAALEDAPWRIDLQLETPNGAVALREWAGGARHVLLKCSEGARLVDNPWRPLERVA